MTQQDAAPTFEDLPESRTYDDLPEADVSTVLSVPLLWGSEEVTVQPPVGAHRRPSGRHRADARRTDRPLRERETLVRHQRGARQRRVPSASGWADHPMTHTARVGLASASLVLAVFAGVLLALALWLP